NRRRSDRSQFYTLRDKRTRDENRLLFSVLLGSHTVFGWRVAKHCSGNHAGREENCGAFRYRRLHKRKLQRGRCAMQIIDAMATIRFPPKQGRQWLSPLPPRPNQNFKLEPLRYTSVDEPASGIVSEARITDRVSTFPECLRWILTENVIASDGKDSASQQM